MTDERRVAPIPKPVDSDAVPTLRDVPPNPISKSERAPSTHADEPDGVKARSGSSNPPGGARKRGRLALRIPDDEVIRPDVARPLPVVVDNAHAQVTRSDSKPPHVVTDGTIVPARIITINPPPSGPPTPEADALAALPTDPGPPIQFDDDALAPSTPRVSVAPTAVATPAEVVVARVPDPRAAEPSESELSADDVVPIDLTPSPPRGIPSLQSVQPPAPPPPASKRTGPTPPAPRPSKPPLVIVPPHMGSVSPQQPEGSGQRRKGRFWWEELFNDDYLRAAERITDAQLAREVDFIEQSLCIERGGAVLDLACGTGRQAVELARRGYQVVGFDLSLAMLARASDEAQERSTKLNFVQGDMREMTFSEQFDGVYSWNTSFGYFEEEKNALVIDRIHNALKGGGLLLLDVVNRDFLVQQSPSLVWFEGDGCVCMDEMVVDFITSRMRVKRTMMLDDGRSREIEYSMRIYSLHELGKMLHEHGFKVCEVSGRSGTPGVFFGNESPRTIVLAEKR